MMEHSQAWRFAYEAFTGSGGFANGGYLNQYPRESDEKFASRQEVAYYANLFAPHVNRYVGYIYKSKPVRQTKYDLIRKIFDDCDGAGNSIDVFMSSFAKEAKVRGVGLVLVDMPKELPQTRADQIEKRALPYLVSIPPEDIIEYKLDRHGKFEFIRFSDILDLSEPGAPNIVTIERYYDQEGWAVYIDGEVYESGSHDLGVCPVLIFSESGRFPDVGEFTRIAALAKRHYNLQSELDEILRSQTFSILTIQAENPSDFELKLSTHNAILYGREMDRPAFIAPEVGPAEIYRKEIERIEELIDKIAYNFTTNRAQESGIALEIKFQGLNSSLANFAMRLEDLEARVFDTVCRYLDLSNDITIMYEKDFSITDPMREIATLEAMKALGYSIPTYERLKLIQIIGNDLEGADIEDLDQIKQEVEDGLKD